ncbi:hypothetical protein Q8F55_008500 [Vanrija albida]|uniref:F-box domain-containing protein n=1 Tax=Vanrija albida TaxID=181172 RepID=A0ABR3PR04_9TREE
MDDFFDALIRMEEVRLAALPPPRVTLADLPPELLIFTSYHLPLRDLGRLRLTCKAVDAALADTVRHTFATLSLVVSQAGLDTVRAIAASPVGAYVKDIVLSRHIVQLGSRGAVHPARAAQFALLGVDPAPAASLGLYGTLPLHARGHFPLPTSAGPDTPLARQLCEAIASLPNLTSVGVGEGFVRPPRVADQWRAKEAERAAYVGEGYRPVHFDYDYWEERAGWEDPAVGQWLPFGLRKLCAEVVQASDAGGYRQVGEAKVGCRVQEDRDERMVDAIFRGALFALAHARGVGNVLATTLSAKGKGMALCDAAFSLTPAETEFTAPLLATLTALELCLRPCRPSRELDEHHNALHAFLHLCPSLVNLRLRLPRSTTFDYDASAVIRLADDPPPFPDLEVLDIQCFKLPPTVLVKLLTQWPLRKVVLWEVCLTEDPELACRMSSAGAPMLWDAVLRAASKHGAGTTQRLVLAHLCEIHDDDDDDDDYDHRPGDAWHVSIRGDGRTMTEVIVTADSRSVASWHRGFTVEGAEGDVFLRAASVLEEPKFIALSDYG